jgi:hypothetical protein
MAEDGFRHVMGLHNDVSDWRGATFCNPDGRRLISKLIGEPLQQVLDIGRLEVIWPVRDVQPLHLGIQTGNGGKVANDGCAYGEIRHVAIISGRCHNARRRVIDASFRLPVYDIFANRDEKRTRQSSAACRCHRGAQWPTP